MGGRRVGGGSRVALMSPEQREKLWVGTRADFFCRQGPALNANMVSETSPLHNSLQYTKSAAKCCSNHGLGRKGGAGFFFFFKTTRGEQVTPTKIQTNASLYFVGTCTFYYWGINTLKYKSHTVIIKVTIFLKTPKEDLSAIWKYCK